MVVVVMVSVKSRLQRVVERLTQIKVILPTAGNCRGLGEQRPSRKRNLSIGVTGLSLDKLFGAVVVRVMVVAGGRIGLLTAPGALEMDGFCCLAACSEFHVLMI